MYAYGELQRLEKSIFSKIGFSDQVDILKHGVKSKMFRMRIRQRRGVDNLSCVSLRGAGVRKIGAGSFFDSGSVKGFRERRDDEVDSLAQFFDICGNRREGGGRMSRASFNLSDFFG